MPGVFAAEDVDQGAPQQGRFSAEDAEPAQAQGKFAAEDIQSPENAAPPVPSVRDVMRMSQPWSSRANASAAIDQAGRLPQAPTLPPAQNRLSIPPPHQGTATQEAE